MIGWACCIILIIPLVYLICKYKEKVALDHSEEQKLITQVELLKQEKNILQNDIDDLNTKTDLAIERYQNTQRQKTEELELYFEGQKRRRQEIMDADMIQRQEELDKSFSNRQQAEELRFQQQIDENNKNINLFADQVNAAEKECNELLEKYAQQSAEAQLKYNGLLEPIRQYEMEKQERLFYTIQLPEEFHEDIEFLLTTVAAKVQHPDIISKLVWAEYVKNYLVDTCKRVDIREEPGIYKLTSLINGKSYIGKSTNVKRRIQDHFKSVVGIQSIADQAVHHAILKEGFWNWTIEIITYCDKDQLNDLERYYIDFFKTQDYGYNRNAGGGG